MRVRVRVRGRVRVRVRACGAPETCPPLVLGLGWESLRCAYNLPYIKVRVLGLGF